MVKIPTVSIMLAISVACNNLARRSLAFSRAAVTVHHRPQQQQQQQRRPFLVSAVTLHHRHQQQQQQQQQQRPFLVSMSTTATTEKEKQASPTPMTLLSGFLGSGKTTALKHLLENAENAKIGVIVNDVASVNIDAKLVSGSTADMVVELQNGCACCSLADELFLSVEKLLKGRDLDAIVVELSGVADPIAIKSNWRAAPESIRKMADVSRVVTLVDSCTFGTDYMTWDSARERKGWTDPADDCAGNRQVAELLAEQVEAANLILVNKIDLATEEEAKIASSVARALNDKAELVEVEFGKVSPAQVLAPVAEKEHDNACEDPDCSDPSHDHSHSHSHSSATCEDSDCSDPSHDHSHSHSHACEDPDCTDESHSHSHQHSTSTDNLGISSFAYRAAVPFNPQKLMKMLNRWPIPIKDVLDIGILQDAQKDGYQVGGKISKENSPFLGVLRSKGFCWFAPSKWSGANDDAWRHDTAMYWSHAGKHFSITAAGKWWGTISKDQMAKYFTDNMEEYERMLREDFVSEEFGDRRQEIVFIGTNIDEAEITSTLNSCLLSDSEMKKYRQKLRNYLDTIQTTSVSSLFDVGAVEHMDME